jgi:type II protein arginine methyltransferase
MTADPDDLQLIVDDASSWLKLPADEVDRCLDPPKRDRVTGSVSTLDHRATSRDAAKADPFARAGWPAGLDESAMQTIPRWHFAMLNDRERNDAFAVALERRLWPGCHVLDIGSGSGLLAMIAVRAGAGKVTTCEANPALAELTRQITTANGMAAVIDVVTMHSTDMRVGHELSSPADFVVSEIVDCGLIGEGLLPTLHHARRELLAPGGELVPQGGRILACLVESEAISRLNRVQHAAGFDVRLFNSVATVGHFPVRLNTWPQRLLSAPVEVVRFDLQSDPLVDDSRLICMHPTTQGVAHGVVAWFELDLGAGVVLRNSPENIASHWMQAFVPFDRPLAVRPFEEICTDVTWSRDRLFAIPYPLVDLEVK